MHSSCLSEQQLRAFQLGQLPEETLDGVAEHLESCPTCETLAQRLDTVLDPILAAIRDPSAPLTPARTRSWQSSSALDKRAAGASSTAFPSLRPAEQADEIGRLGHYRVLRLLGKGGMAFVFHAEDLTLRRPVALKVMKPELSGDAEGWQRFCREARILASIKHDHLVTVFQAGQEGPVVYLAMELLEGESLEDRLKRACPAALDEILRLGREIASGLAVVHRNGLVHRDLKPGNIWLEAPAARVKILDFGLARFVNDEVNLTDPGTIMGTPSFMSPEQASGAAVDARSDLFSLGCILYWLCTGVKPFDGENTMAVLTELAIKNPRPVHELNPALPQVLSDLVTQLLAKHPDERPAGAEAVLERLKLMDAERKDRHSAFVAPASAVLPVAVAVVTPQRTIGPRMWKVLALVGVLGVLALGVWALLAGRVGSPQPIETAPVYLSSLDAIEPVQWPFPGKLPGPPPPEEPADWPPPQGGRRVYVKGNASPHGIWMHLPREKPQMTSVSYRLGKRFSSFTTEVSLADGPPICIPLTFAVYGDGQLLWKSNPVSRQKDTQACTALPVKDVEKLTLETSGSGDARGTHAVWIEPYLTK